MRAVIGIVPCVWQQSDKQVTGSPQRRYPHLILVWSSLPLLKWGGEMSQPLLVFPCGKRIPDLHAGDHFSCRHWEKRHHAGAVPTPVCNGRDW